MRKVGGNTGSVDNIVESKLVNVRASLEEQREGLNRTNGLANISAQSLAHWKLTWPMPPEAPATTGMFVSKGYAWEIDFHGPRQPGELSDDEITRNTYQL